MSWYEANVCTLFKFISGSTDGPVVFTDAQVFNSQPPDGYQKLPCSGYVDKGATTKCVSYI